MLGFILILLILAFPLAFLVFECILFTRAVIKKEKNKDGLTVITDLFTVFLGLCYEFVYIEFFKEASLSDDWQKQLYNGQHHTPIYSGALLTVVVLSVIGFAGYVYIRSVNVDRMPPLMACLSMSAMYLGLIELILFTVQVLDFNDYAYFDLYLLVLPICCILITFRTIYEKITEWQAVTMEKSKIEGSPVLSSFDEVLSKSQLWPVYAVFFAIPLLGVLILILMLFGQAPDAVIKAWTETSDWRLSMRQGPQNVMVDEHYLCTVAAGGHRKVVKPIRKGVRHGHEVIVNRQLCIANAFEEIIQEKTPRFHRAVRSFYDTYGFPVARLIKKRWVADMVYFIMKPLEWIFLIVIYMVDVHPENRIAVQYMGK